MGGTEIEFYTSASGLC